MVSVDNCYTANDAGGDGDEDDADGNTNDFGKDNEKVCADKYDEDDPFWWWCITVIQSRVWARRVESELHSVLLAYLVQQQF